VSGTESLEKSRTLLEGRRAQLRPLDPGDTGWIYRLATTGSNLTRWRLRGSTPSADRFLQFLFHESLVQLVVTPTGSDQPAGLFQLINADMRNGFAYLTALIDTDEQRAGWPFEGLLLFINYAFETWPLRKIYVESLSGNVGQFQSTIGRFLVEEARFSEHEFANGAFEDLHVFALTRARWAENAEAIAWISGTSN
jgi:RimJ/RimL family protein N-acetyltransferase